MADREDQMHDDAQRTIERFAREYGDIAPVSLVAAAIDWYVIHGAIKFVREDFIPATLALVDELEAANRAEMH